MLFGTSSHTARRAGLDCVFGVDDEGQFLVVDLDRFGGVHGPVLGVGDHHRDRLADVARLVGGQEHVRADEDGAAAGRVQLHVELGFRQRVVRNGGEFFRETIGAGEHREHAFHFLRARRVDVADARVRIRRAHHRRVGLPLEQEVVAELAAAGDQPLVLRPPDRFSDEAEVGLVHRCCPYGQTVASSGWAKSGGMVV